MNYLDKRLPIHQATTQLRYARYLKYHYIYIYIYILDVINFTHY
jgi:hypothetical protein